MRDSLPSTQMNHHAKFDAASFIIGGEIRNRTNKHTHTKTVTDISTPCLSACVDNQLLIHVMLIPYQTVYMFVLQC